jgi:hypothetical protein
MTTTGTATEGTILWAQSADYRIDEDQWEFAKARFPADEWNFLAQQTIKGNHYTTINMLRKHTGVENFAWFCLAKHLWQVADARGDFKNTPFNLAQLDWVGLTGNSMLTWVMDFYHAGLHFDDVKKFPYHGVFRTDVIIEAVRNDIDIELLLATQGTR